MKLLVSPKSLEEAKVVVKHEEVDFIDCKNPREGSLGANFPWIINQMKNLIQINSSQLLSATIGDFPNLPGTASLAALGAAVAGADIIKIGLKGPSTENECIFLMDKVVKAVKDYNKNIKIVAAGYADKIRMKSSPDFLSLPVIAAKSGADIVMLDTYIKDGKGLFDFLTIEQLKLFRDTAKELNLEVALAGNLRKDSLPQIKEIWPDIIGVRSLVCEGYDRINGMIKGNLIEELKAELYR
ncbi:MAG: (5-formylfuran-3-yl)methyl phosphate synthase [Candidatus Lokiarchaeota archaeon]|nr:(5-formylfuran-3-yl)methyl phosphate synthase [Candidatus Lokiarchaeota archaeon]